MSAPVVAVALSVIQAGREIPEHTRYTYMEKKETMTIAHNHGNQARAADGHYSLTALL